MESHTKTIAKRARVGPRTPVVPTMKIMFEVDIPSKSWPGSPIIAVDTELKIWIELIKSRNDNAMEKFYRLWTFQKWKIFEKILIRSRETVLLCELSEREPD